MISTQALANIIKLTPRQAQRIAPNVPTAKRCGKTARAHWRFDETSPLFKSWIARQRIAGLTAPKNAAQSTQLEKLHSMAFNLVGLIQSAQEKEQPAYWTKMWRGQTQRAIWLGAIDRILDIYGRLEELEMIPKHLRRIAAPERLKRR